MKAILTYHSIDDSGSPISVPESAFRAHVRWLASGAVRVVSVDELLALPADADAVAVTFDDGFENFGTVAAPLLLDHGLPATVFVVTDHVGTTNAWGGLSVRGIPTLPLLDWAALGRLAERGITLGAHTRRHPDLVEVNGSRLTHELDGSARELEARTGVRPAGFAYPYGSVDIQVAARASVVFRWACTTELRPLAPRDSALLLPRLDMYYFRAPGRLESWGTARFHSHLRLRARVRRIRQNVLSGFPQNVVYRAATALESSWSRHEA